MLDNADELTRRAYSAMAPTWEQTHDDAGFWLKYMKRLARLKPGGKLLEVGCATGRDGELLVKLGFDYLGTDVVEDFVIEAKRQRPKLCFEVSNLEDLHRYGFFDVVYSVATLIHINKEAMLFTLKTLGSQLTPSGILAVSLKQGNSEGLVAKHGHQRFYNRYQADEFSFLLEQAGLNVILCKEHRRRSSNDTWLMFFAQKPVTSQTP